MNKLDRRHFLTTAAAGLASIGATKGRGLALQSEDDPLGVRTDFPITNNLRFLATSWVGPMPQVVRDVGVEYVDEKLHWADTRLRLEKKEMTRIAFANLFGAKPEEVALLFATGDAENIVTRGLDLKAGDNVVVDDLHFTASFVLYRQLEKDLGIELRIVPQTNGRTRLEDFDAVIDDKTRLVSVAWVSNRNGYRHDLTALADLAHAKNALLFTDAVQAIGTFPANLQALGVDFLVAGSYKWLFANFGVAPFFIREEHLESIPPDRYGHGQVVETLTSDGWSSSHRVGRTRELGYRYMPTAEKYEHASLAFNPVAQLNAALGYLSGVGLARIAEHTQGLAHEFWEGANKLGFEMFTPRENASPIVSIIHGRDPDQLKQLLEEESIVVTFREADHTLLRVSVSLFNNRSDIQQLLKVLERVA